VTVDRNEGYVVLQLNSARQRRVGGVSSSRRSSILTGWRMSAAESISARVRGQGKLDGSRSGAGSSVAWAMTRRVPPGATRRGSMARAVLRAVPWSGWMVEISTTRSKAPRQEAGGFSRAGGGESTKGPGEPARGPSVAVGEGAEG